MINLPRCKKICDLKENLLSREEALRVGGLENGELCSQIGLDEHHVSLAFEARPV